MELWLLQRRGAKRRMRRLIKGRRRRRLSRLYDPVINAPKSPAPRLWATVVACRPVLPRAIQDHQSFPEISRERERETDLDNGAVAARMATATARLRGLNYNLLIWTPKRENNFYCCRRCDRNSAKKEPVRGALCAAGVNNPSSSSPPPPPPQRGNGYCSPMFTLRKMWPHHVIRAETELRANKTLSLSLQQIVKKSPTPLAAVITHRVWRLSLCCSQFTKPDNS